MVQWLGKLAQTRWARLKSPWVKQLTPRLPCCYLSAWFKGSMSSCTIIIDEDVHMHNLPEGWIGICSTSWGVWPHVQPCRGACSYLLSSRELCPHLQCLLWGMSTCTAPYRVRLNVQFLVRDGFNQYVQCPLRSMSMCPASLTCQGTSTCAVTLRGVSTFNVCPRTVWVMDTDGSY